MKYIILAPFGEEINSLLEVFKDLTIQKIILLVLEEHKNKIYEFKNIIEKLKIPIDIRPIKSFNLENIFTKVKEINNENKEGEILICASTSDKYTASLFSSAAYVNNLKVFHIINAEVIFMPLLRFSYCEELGKRKIQILKTLYEQNCCASLEELSKTLKISLPLASYHINGTSKSKGLKELGLVDILNYKNRIDIKISSLGLMVLKGYIGTAKIPLEKTKEENSINVCAN